MPLSLLYFLLKACFSEDFYSNDRPDKNIARSDYKSVHTREKTEVLK